MPHTHECAARRTECRAMGGTASNCTSGTYLVPLPRWKLCDDDDVRTRIRRENSVTRHHDDRRADGNRLKTRRDNFRRRPGREPRGPGPCRRRRRRPTRPRRASNCNIRRRGWATHYHARCIIDGLQCTEYGLRTTNASVTLWGSFSKSLTLCIAWRKEVRRLWRLPMGDI